MTKDVGEEVNLAAIEEQGAIVAALSDTTAQRVRTTLNEHGVATLFQLVTQPGSLDGVVITGAYNVVASATPSGEDLGEDLPPAPIVEPDGIVCDPATVDTVMKGLNMISIRNAKLPLGSTARKIGDTATSWYVTLADARLVRT